MSSRLSSSSSTSSAAWPSARHTLFLRVHSAAKLELSTSHSSYCKLYLGDTPVVSSTANMSTLFIKNEAENLPNHRTFHTKVTTSKLKTTAIWNEKFEIPLDNIKKQILSIRVKSQHQLLSPSIGACAIALKDVRIGLTIDKNFELFKGSTPVGTIRLQMMIRDNYPDQGSEKEVKSVKQRVSSDQDPKQRRQSMEMQEEEKQRKQREKLEQEKLRIEQKMERLRVEEEERARRRREEEERRLAEEARLAAEKAQREKEKEEKRRRKELAKRQEEEMIKKLTRERRMSSTDAGNQARGSGSRMSSRETVLTVDDENENDNEGGRGSSDDEDKSLRKASKSAPELNRRRSISSRSDRRRSTLSLRDVIDEVVQDALPSDSDTSSDELDTEDEFEFVRQMAKLKIKMLRKKKLRKSMQREKRGSSVASDSFTKQKHHVTKKHRRSVASTSSSSSSSSSSSESSDDDTHARKSKSSKKAKKEKKSKANSNQDDDTFDVKALTPGEIAKRTGSSNNNELTAGQVFEAAMNVANVVCADGDDEAIVENIPETIDAIQSLMPIGKFIGRKLQEASAKVAQMKEKEQPTYYF